MPNHVCEHVARMLVRAWAMERWGQERAAEEETFRRDGHDPAAGPIHRLLREWPLPASTAALRAWGRYDGAPVDMLPKALADTEEEVWIGLVVERRTPDGGTVTLLGLVDAEGCWLPEPNVPANRHSRPMAEDDALLRVERDLYGWYVQCIAGGTMHAGGAKKRKDLPPAEKAAMRRIVEDATERKRYGATWATIADHHHLDTKTLYEWREAYRKGEI